MYLPPNQRPDIELASNGVLYFRFPRNAIMTAEAIRYCLNEHRRLAPGIKSPVIFVGNHGNPMDKELHDLINSDAVVELTKAVALVTSTSIGRMLANMYLKLVKTPYPVRWFADEDAASKWLKSQ